MSVLKVVYDLKSAPATFDFAGFLAISECMRQLSGEDWLDVTILADGFRQQTQRDVDTNEYEKIARIHGILLQLMPLVPTLSGYRVEHMQPYPFQHPQPIVSPYTVAQVGEFHKEGADPRVMRAPAHAASLVPECDVTLTIRTSNHFPERNCDLIAWHKFYEKLTADGLKVLVIPDQEDLLNQGAALAFDWELFTPASWNMSLRLALYEKAKLNVTTANGPPSVLYYSHCPFIMFDILKGGVFEAKKWAKMHGVKKGESMAWLDKNQRITWTNSEYQNLVDEFEKSL